LSCSADRSSAATRSCSGSSIELQDRSNEPVSQWAVRPIAGAQPSHHSNSAAIAARKRRRRLLVSGKAHAIAGFAACGPGYSSSSAAECRGVSQARQIRAPVGPTTARSPQNGHSPRSSSENQERASTSGGSRLTPPRLGRGFSHGIGRKTHPTLSRVLLKLKARAASLLRRASDSLRLP